MTSEILFLCFGRPRIAREIQAIRNGKKYRRSAMENARQLQCKPLLRLQKSRRRNNNGKQWKKQCAEQSKQADIRARVYVQCERLRSSDVVACDRWRPNEKARRGGRAALAQIRD
jgi:hypothetical protein